MTKPRRPEYIPLKFISSKQSTPSQSTRTAWCLMSPFPTTWRIKVQRNIVMAITISFLLFIEKFKTWSSKLMQFKERKKKKKALNQELEHTDSSSGSAINYLYDFGQIVWPQGHSFPTCKMRWLNWIVLGFPGQPLLRNSPMSGSSPKNTLASYQSFCYPRTPASTFMIASNNTDFLCKQISPRGLGVWFDFLEWFS